MKRYLLVALAVCAVSSEAQQRTTGDIVGENFMRGRQMRQAIDERRARAEKAREEEELAALARQEARQKAHDQTAYRSPSLILRSKNGLPDIVLSDLPANGCQPSFKAAFTKDADGNLVKGCGAVGSGGAHIVWNGYGVRAYDLSAWEVTQPSSADDAPLGSY